MAKDVKDVEHDTLTHQIHSTGETYEDCTRVELEQMAGQRGVVGHSGMSKEQLIEELRDAGAL